MANLPENCPINGKPCGSLSQALEELKEARKAYEQEKQWRKNASMGSVVAQEFIQLKTDEICAELEKNRILTSQVASLTAQLAEVEGLLPSEEIQKALRCMPEYSGSYIQPIVNVWLASIRSYQAHKPSPPSPGEGGHLAAALSPVPPGEEK